jgi:DMSO/TMAO reductase YedYZ molybdopterin-dependent catalytic subunit
LELVELDASLVCVHNPVGGFRAGAARWLGIPLKALLATAGVQQDSNQVLTRSITGFTAGIPLDMAEEGPIPLVALGMNGEPLTVRNGFPARLLTPGIWGADANTKWLEAIELTRWDRASDYWDIRGWPRTPGRVKPGSRIDVPADRITISAGATVVAGIAWAPRSGVAAVEVSVDGGEWRRARLSRELAPTLWRQWALIWWAGPGEHQLRARTLSHDEAQKEAPSPPYPRGSSGYHTVDVHVERAGARPPAWKQGFIQARSDLTGRLRLAAMAPPAWWRHGFPRRPTFPEPLPRARRSVREWLPSNP